MILKLIPVLFLLHGSQCSTVIDSFGQKGIYVSDYCPHMKYCAEGAHVMCMYYDPNRTFGPRCSNPQNITITPELANQLLDVINAIRSKIANGKETGHNNTKLPRGYGIFRLRWDNELATFAQVFANQCMLRHDFCRATKRFPEPCQTAGLVRFPYPGWDPMLSSSASVLNEDKLSYSVMQILKSWYSQKSYVTEDMVKQYPNWESRPNSSGKLYLEIIRGAVTHMGCGMSAYTEFLYYHQNRPLDGRKGGQNYNSVEIICNFSSRSKPGQKTYWTSHPANAYNSQCGCPEGTQEDADCLCNEVSAAREQKKQGLTIGVQTEADTCPNPENNCEPTLVLLPIFTVEDAPPEKLIERARDIEEPLATYVMDRLDNRTNMAQRTRSIEIFNFFDDADKEHQVAPMPHSLKTVLAPEQEPIKLPKPPTPSISLPTPSKKKYVQARKEYARARPDPEPPEPVPEQEAEPEPEVEPIIVAEPEPTQKPKHTYVPKTVLRNPKRSSAGKKSSIFTRAAKFKLPNGRRKFGQYDVKPRKDFKNIERVVNDYIKRRNNKMGYRRNEVVTSKHEEILKKVTLATTMKVEETTEAILKAEEKVMNFNQYLKPKANLSSDDSTKHYDLKYEEGDNKLMTLLDTLEREVKHIELDGDEKEIFDAKIRKIYGSVVGKPVDLLVPTMPKPKPKPEPPPLPPPPPPPPPPPVHSVDRESDFMESDFGESKTYLKHESNHLAPENVRSRSEFITEDDRNLEKKVKPDYLEHKHIDKLDRKYSKNADDKYSDILDNKSFNDNEMFDNDQKLFSDIERKYNDRLAHVAHSVNKLDRKYIDENLDSKYGDNLGRKYDDAGSRKHTSVLAPRNQNKLMKYENLKHRVGSGEDRKHRGFDKFREREPRTSFPREDADRNYFRNGEDDRKQSPIEKRGKYGHTEFEHEDPLSSERRKYYQDKLENLERRLHSTRSYRRRKNDDRGNERPMRRMRPNMDRLEAVRTRSKSQGDSFYVPDRARFLHGF